MIFENNTNEPDWDRLDAFKFADEEDFTERLLKADILPASMRSAAVRRARRLVEKARRQGRRKGMMESFLEEFGLANSEGLALMCLAEALLRVPDAETRDALIAEKIRSGDWGAHNGQSESWLVNASTWGLMLTGQVIGPPPSARRGPGAFIQNLVRESGEPVIRAAMMQAMRIMGEQFVLGRTVSEALNRGKRMIKSGEAAHFSFDMLGEGARTQADAERYFMAYQSAIEALSQSQDGAKAPEDKSGISIKLSALHPRYEAVNEARISAELYPRLLVLCKQARAANLNLCLDAEEADRLVLSLNLLTRLVSETDLAGWSGLGLAVQAYQKRAQAVIQGLTRLARDRQMRLMVRLVKGAYWDSEIKHAQEQGFVNFPVFTTKQGTDLSYLACARLLLRAGPDLYPQFATHNAHTLAAIDLMAEAENVSAYEYQRLHGMGEALYAAAQTEQAVRIYAPVGAHRDLLPYLVRRLLENGANTSFVNRFLDPDVPVEVVVDDPVTKLETGPRRHPRIATPPRLYGGERLNASGFDLSQKSVRHTLSQAVRSLQEKYPLQAGPLLTGRLAHGPGQAVFAPACPDRRIAELNEALPEHIDQALKTALNFQPEWDGLGGDIRADILRAMADGLESQAEYLIALMAEEAGKTLADGVAELREAVDFCRYYASQAAARFAHPLSLPGPAGETNEMRLHGRGVFVCISPWNFPLAIFTGQIAAALAAGNTVVAKPAEQTPLIGYEAVRCFRQAGLPEAALQFLPGRGETVGAGLCADPRISGVCFTGGTDTARLINQTLARREGPIIPLIAETGGLNAMFVDTTALREQVIDDIIISAFGSAGQRCSALRLVCLPYQTANGLIEGLKGAMDELKLGEPGLHDTDIGPVIDTQARQHLTAYIDQQAERGKVLKRLAVPQTGSFCSPALIELESIEEIDHEIFGPVLHILRYDPDQVEAVCQALKAKGYGLTLGIHSRLDSFARRVISACPVGNTYINRTMIGAVVGVQPFGGEGLSGTGPKAGGPFTLLRFATERTITHNITAQGGDPDLLNL